MGPGGPQSNRNEGAGDCLVPWAPGPSLTNGGPGHRGTSPPHVVKALTEADGEGSTGVARCQEGRGSFPEEVSLSWVLTDEQEFPRQRREASDCWA